MPSLVKRSLAIDPTLLLGLHIRVERALELGHSLGVILVFVGRDTSEVDFNEGSRFQIHDVLRSHVRQIHVIPEALLDHLVVAMSNQEGKGCVRRLLVSSFLQSYAKGVE
jgi:hypothetical protein